MATSARRTHDPRSGHEPARGGTPARRSTARAFTPDVARSIVGIALLVLGAITLIALILPGEGALTDWWTRLVAPWFGTGRWLLPFCCSVAGWYVEPAARAGSRLGWGMTLAGLAIAYVAGLGAVRWSCKGELSARSAGGGRDRPRSSPVTLSRC